VKTKPAITNSAAIPLKTDSLFEIHAESAEIVSINCQFSVFSVAEQFTVSEA
jgi:hypothetical protein